MGRSRKPVQTESSGSTTGQTARDETIAERYSSQPSPRRVVPEWADRPSRPPSEPSGCASGPPARPFRELIAALRAERERQGLSLADLAERTGMDRAAVHKLEIGLNSNPTYATLTRYASALGTRIEWHLKTIPKKPPAP